MHPHFIVWKMPSAKLGTKTNFGRLASNVPRTVGAAMVVRSENTVILLRYRIVDVSFLSDSDDQESNNSSSHFRAM